MGAVPEAGTDAAARAGGRRWSFGTAVFDERSYELRVNGQPVELERKSLEVLRQLLYRAGEVVTKDELLELVWPGRVVSESVPAKCISRIREAIGDDAQAIIKTAHGYGYRLVASVKVETSRAATALTRLDLKAGDHPPLRPLWSLVRQLGAGGQGEIWLVRHDKTREERVYKFALDVAGLAAIKREITLSRFLHETLEGRDEFIRVLDWNLEEAPYYVELEHASGNLESWAEAQGGLASVPLTVRLEIMAKVADALAAAHSVGVLHKDLKPSNVLIAGGSDGAPKVKLADFGSGSVLDPERLAAMGITRMDVVTRSMVQGDMPGTFMYLAPEVMAGQPATVQADVYSLGVMLYQMVIGDFRGPLAPGWELGISDPLLSDDIASAVAGDPARRLRDPSEMSSRLRSLDERRRRHAQEQAEKLRLDQERQAAQERARKAELAFARLRARRNWMLTALATLIVGFSLSLSLYLQARRAQNEAAAAAASSKAVADFLSKDMFAVVSSRPLRDLTVPELLDAASNNLANRTIQMPGAAAEIHAALGNAFWAMERVDDAREHLDAALTQFERVGEAASETAVAAATRLIIVEVTAGKRSGTLARYERVLGEGVARLGSQHPAVLGLRQQLAMARFILGDWQRAADDLRRLIADQKSAAPGSSQTVGVAQVQLARILVTLGDSHEAEKVLRDALVGLSGSDLAVAQARALLGQALTCLERFGEADTELARALELMRPWVVGDQSGQVLSVQYMIGQLRLREGRTVEAVAILERIVKTLGALEWAQRSNHMSEILSWLATAYMETGKLDNAESSMRRALEISEAVDGKLHPQSQSIRVGVAALALRRYGPAAARKILEEVEPAVFQRLGSDHPFMAELRRVQGLTVLAEGKGDEARIELSEALRLFESRYGPKHKFTARARAELSQASSKA